MDKIIPGKEVILLSDESMKVVEDLIANPPAPSAKLRELMNRPQRAKISDDLFLNPVKSDPGNPDLIKLQILKGREGGVSRGQLYMMQSTEPSYKCLMDVGVPEAAAISLYFKLMAKHFAEDSAGSLKQAAEQLALDIRLAKGNWCKFMTRHKPNTHIYMDRLLSYMQYGVYLYYLDLGMYEHGAFKRMQELKEDIEFYAIAIERDVKMKNGTDKMHWLSFGTMIVNVIRPLCETGLVDHSKIVFFYETRARLNLS